MNSWVEDIAKAMINIGRPAKNYEIYKEVEKIREKRMPKTWKVIVKIALSQNSAGGGRYDPDKADLFYRVHGTDGSRWALHEGAAALLLASKRRSWVEDVVEAMEHLGGQATYAELYAEVRRVRGEPIPPSWKSIVRYQIRLHSSDSEDYDPNKEDLFFSLDRSGTGPWGLRSRRGSPDAGG